MSPLFSVIVPIYNVEEYLRQCIESVLNQTYSDFELVLVDDGSPDNSGKICDEYAEKDARIKVIHQANGGLVNARKSGASAASGAYVFNLDGDDWIENNCLEKFSETIKATNADIISCGEVTTDGTKKGRYHFHMMPPGLYEKAEIEKNFFPILIENANGKQHPTVVNAIKRELYLDSQLKVNPLIKIGEDHAYLKPCVFNANSIYILDGAYYNYRIISSSMTKQKKAYAWDVPKILGEHFEKQIPAEFVKKQIARYVTHQLFLVAISQFYEKRSYKETAKNIKSHLEEPYYQQAISNCSYDKRYFMGQLAEFVLKKQCIFLMYLFCKINTIRRMMLR